MQPTYRDVRGAFGLLRKSESQQCNALFALLFSSAQFGKVHPVLAIYHPLQCCTFISVHCKTVNDNIVQTFCVSLSFNHF